MSWPSTLLSSLFSLFFPNGETARGDAVDTMFLTAFLDRIIQQFEDVLDR